MNSRRPRSLADYSRAARRRKLILVVPALVLAIATAITLRDLPNLYESTARMRFTSVKTDGRELEHKDPWLTGVRSDLSVTTPSLSSRSSQPSPEAIRAQQMTIDGLKDQQYKIHQQLADVDRRITAQRQIVEQQKKGSTLRDNPTYAVLIAKRTELQGQRYTLINRQELTDKQPRVLAINDQIAAINRQIEELRQQDTALGSQSPEARELAALEVFANLQYGIENGKGIVVVTGEVGTGKTTTLRSMLQSLDRSVLAAYIFNPILSTAEFFDLLAGEFRMRPQQSKAVMLRLIGNVLMLRHSQGLPTVVVVDEAHLLPHHLLEEIRLLSNFETNREKLLQVILCGQPELHELLGQPELRQLKQRVGLKSSIRTLTPHETGEYARWRLRIAGCTNENLFEPEAIKMVHRFSRGIPRIINNICDNALLTGFSEGSSRVTIAIINDVVEELDLTSIEIVSAKTIAETVIQRDGLPSELAAPSNVRYIRRDAEAATGKSNAVAAGNGKYVICSESEDASETPLTFFSRVRVSKNS